LHARGDGAHLDLAEWVLPAVLAGRRERIARNDGDLSAQSVGQRVGQVVAVGVRRVLDPQAVDASANTASTPENFRSSDPLPTSRSASITSSSSGNVLTPIWLRVRQSLPSMISSVQPLPPMCATCFTMLVLSQSLSPSF